MQAVVLAWVSRRVDLGHNQFQSLQASRLAVASHDDDASLRTGWYGVPIQPAE